MKCKTQRQLARAEARKAAKAQAEADKLLAEQATEMLRELEAGELPAKQPSAAKRRKNARRQHEDSCSRGRQGAPRGPRRNAATGELDPLDCCEALLQRFAA